MPAAAVEREVPASRVLARPATQPVPLAAVWAAIAASWTVATVVQLSGHASLLHHHTLVEHGPPLWLAIPSFLLGWQVMVASMMLPASLPTIRSCCAGLAARARPYRALATFLGAYALIWTVFGLGAFMGDFVLHHVVDATPWLAANSWLIGAGVVGLAGTYQLTSLKRRSLARCRDSAALGSAGDRSSVQLGVQHAIDCLGSSWALMLLMFAEGFANLWWMAALTAVMVYETTGRHGDVAARLAGLVLVAFAGQILLGGPAA